MPAFKLEDQQAGASSYYLRVAVCLCCHGSNVIQTPLSYMQGCIGLYTFGSVCMPLPLQLYFR